MQTATYRYPGLRPFQSDERDRFFGRDQEIADLLALLGTERTVILFGRSGTGKSSLINAGIVPALNSTQGARVISFRSGTFQGGGNDSLTARAVQFIDETSGNKPPPKWFSNLPRDEQAVWYPLKKIQLAENCRSFILVIDQAEEIFTFPPEVITGLKRQLAELQNVEVPKIIRDELREKYMSNKTTLSEEEEKDLFKPLNIKFLFTIRSDRLSLLSSFADYLPNILRRTYELNPISRQQAQIALVGPAGINSGHFASPPFQYQDGTIARLINYLSKDGTATVDPVQLQIVASYVEHQVIDTGITAVAPEMLGDLRSIYSNYYENQINALPPAEQLPARRLLEEGLIYEEEERRLSLYEGQIFSEFGLSPTLLSELRSRNLIRGEIREQGSVAYEISHDTLVAPILKAKRERLREEEQMHREAALREAQLRAEEERLRREMAEKQRARARRLAVVAFLASCTAMVLAFGTFWAYKQAKSARDVATENTQKAEMERNRARVALEREAVARMIADSSATIARQKSEEAERAWQQAQKNLQRALDEEKKVRSALTEVTKARKESENARKEAELNLISALQAKREADRALVALSVQSDSLQTSENALKSAIADQIQRLKDNIEEAILNLEYESAYSQCIQLLKLNSDKTDMEVKNLVQELAYFYQLTELDNKAKIRSLLNGIGISDDSEKSVVNISPANFNLLRNRYFPEMMPVGTSLSAGKTEVTYWQFNVYVKATKQALPAAPGWQITGDRPVTNISWYDAIAYSNWLTFLEGKKDFAYDIQTQKPTPNTNGYSPVWVWVPRFLWSAYKDRKAKIIYNKSSKGYRLPTETDWKQMAGPAPDLPNAAAWLNNNSGNQTQPVAGKYPNKYNLHDMYGNAQEWCWSDDFPGSYTERKGIQGVREQVLLGGSWNSTESQLKNRILSAPFNTYNTNGFRVVRNK